MNEEFLRNILFPVIRAGMDINVEKLEISEEDCNKLMYVGKIQDILPIILRGLKKLEIDNNAVKKIDEMCRKDIYRFAVQDNALANICNVLEEAKIPYMPLKGSVLRELYPEKWIRTASDIDVLVHEEDLERAIDYIKKNTDFDNEKRAHHDVSFTHNHVHLELHFSILRNKENIDKKLKDVWENSVREKDTYRFKMTPEFHLFYITAHMYSHFKNGGLGIRPYIDLWLLKKNVKINEKTFNDLIDFCDIKKFYDASCDLLGVWFEGKEHTEISQNMEKFCFQGGALGSEQNTVAIYRKKHSAFRYILHLAFLDRKSFEYMYPELKEKPFLLPYYRIKRLIRILTKKRGKIKNTVELIKTVDKNKVESFDNYMNNMDF